MGDEEETSDVKGFAMSTTAHGLKYVFSAESWKFRRFAWLHAFLVASTLVIYQVIICSIEYYKYPVKTEIKLTRMSSMDFPTVTICNLNRADATIVKHPQALTDIFRVAHSCMWSVVLDKTLEDMNKNETYRPYLQKKYGDLLGQLAWKVEDIFEYCEWEGMHIPCKDILTAHMTMQGYCYQLNGDQTKPMVSPRPGVNGGFFATLKTSLRGHTISDMGSYGFKVLIHSMYDAPDIISQGMVISPGFSYRISFMAETIKYLPYPFKSQGDMYCNDYPPPTKKQMAMKEVRADMHSLTACMSMKAGQKASKYCKCELKSCTFYEYLMCWEPVFTEIYDTASKTDMLGCSIPCTLRSYRPVISQAAFPSPDVNELMEKMDMLNGTPMERQEYLGLTLFFEDLILRETLIEPVFHNLSLIGVLGGNMGLLLGASILTVVEFIEFIITLCWRVFYKNKNKAATELNKTDQKVQGNTTERSDDIEKTKE